MEQSESWEPPSTLERVAVQRRTETMMGSRKPKGGDEYDALSRKARRVLTLRPAAIRAAKRSFNKRTRKEARTAAQQEAPPKFHCE
jgi:hypothetical protein